MNETPPPNTIPKHLAPFEVDGEITRLKTKFREIETRIVQLNSVIGAVPKRHIDDFRAKLLQAEQKLEFIGHELMKAQGNIAKLQG